MCPILVRLNDFRPHWDMRVKMDAMIYEYMDEGKWAIQRSVAFNIVYRTSGVNCCGVSEKKGGSKARARAIERETGQTGKGGGKLQRDTSKRSHTM